MTPPDDAARAARSRRLLTPTAGAAASVDAAFNRYEGNFG
jgi:hypothetical protein